MTNKYIQAKYNTYYRRPTLHLRQRIKNKISMIQKTQFGKCAVDGRVPIVILSIFFNKFKLNLAVLF